MNDPEIRRWQSSVDRAKHQRDTAIEGQRHLVREIDAIRRNARRQGAVIAVLSLAIGAGAFEIATWLIEVCR